MGAQGKSVQLKEGLQKGLTPELSPKGQGGVSQKSISEEHGEGWFGQKESRCKDAGRGSMFRGMKAVWPAGVASSEK